MPIEPDRLNTNRRGIATLWLIVALPVLLLAMCFAVESGRLWLMRQQLTTSIESAALASVKEWDHGESLLNTIPSRQTAIDFARVNTVDGNAVGLDANFNLANPNGNASCGGDIVLGTLLNRVAGRVFNAGLPAGCGSTDGGPNAVALYRESTDGWQTVSLCGRNYTCPIVVATPNYTEATTPSVVRIRNAGPTGFDFFVQSTNTGAPVDGIPVHFLVVEEGVYNVGADGVKMEAVKYNSTVTDRATNQWNAEPRAYLNAYAQPVVVGQVMTYNDPDWSVFWSRGNTNRNPANAILRTGKHVGEDPDTTRANETIGYIVIEQGAGTMKGLPYYAALGGNAIRGMQNTGPFPYGLPGAPTAPGGYAVASQTAMDGNNGSWAVLYGADPVNDVTLNLAVDEDQLKDVDRSHVAEQVGYIILAGPYASRVETQITVDFMCTFGCTLAPTSLQSHAYAVFDCGAHRPRLTKVDQFICPGP